jgi:hypothetical protein
MTTVKQPANPDYGPEIRSGEKVESPTPNARQGVTDHNVRYVLAISLAGVIFIFAVIYFLFFATP